VTDGEAATQEWRHQFFGLEQTSVLDEINCLSVKDITYEIKRQ
jgi:hypothetical protein